MNTIRAGAIFSILVGISMFGMWAMFLLTGQVPELQSEPWRIALHLSAEFSTAIALIASGYGLLRDCKWAKPVALFALGMLLYTVIQSPGYFIQNGETGFVYMFAVLGVLSVFFAAQLGKDSQPR